MDFRIADTFTGSLARLTGDEQKAVKTTAFDLQLNPSSPGMSFHKLDKAKDKNFWSVRVSGDIRLIVHKTPSSLLLCYVDHHDKAYDWAERRKLQTHPKTGAARLIEIRETVQEILVPTYVEVERPKRVAVKKQLFAQYSEEDLLGYGVPAEWLADVRAATEDTPFALADHLPAEAAEALLELAAGGKPRVAQSAAAAANPRSSGRPGGVLPHEFGLFVRSVAQLERAKAAAKESRMPFKILDEHVETTSGHFSIGTMHLAKGPEFRAVAVMACDDEIIPLQERIETVGDDADLQEVYDTERHLLNVACTRARDHLLVTSVEPASEFLDDLRS
jgi:mRNA-degrading endonuclease RelE of RelBE toxin-antitoxin system